jgi:hypothetical protein
LGGIDFYNQWMRRIVCWILNRLFRNGQTIYSVGGKEFTHSAAPSAPFESGVKKRRSGSTLSPWPELGPKATPDLQTGESKG